MEVLRSIDHQTILIDYVLSQFKLKVFGPLINWYEIASDFGTLYSLTPMLDAKRSQKIILFEPGTFC